MRDHDFVIEHFWSVVLLMGTSAMPAELEYDNDTD